MDLHERLTAARPLLAPATGGDPFAALKKKLGERGWAEASQRLLQALRRRLPTGEADLAAEAILTFGKRA